MLVKERNCLVEHKCEITSLGEVKLLLRRDMQVVAMILKEEKLSCRSTLQPCMRIVYDGTTRK